MKGFWAPSKKQEVTEIFWNNRISSLDVYSSKIILASV